MMLTKKQYVEKLNWADIVYADKLEDWVQKHFAIHSGSSTQENGSTVCKDLIMKRKFCLMK